MKKARTITKLCVGDSVLVISGKEKGKVGEILFISRKKSMVLLKGLALRKRLVRNQENPKGVFMNTESPIHISNVMYYLKEEKKPTRLRFVRDGDSKQRVSVRFGVKV